MKKVLDILVAEALIALLWAVDEDMLCSVG